MEEAKQWSPEVVEKINLMAIATKLSPIGNASKGGWNNDEELQHLLRVRKDKFRSYFITVNKKSKEDRKPKWSEVKRVWSKTVQDTNGVVYHVPDVSAENWNTDCMFIQVFFDKLQRDAYSYMFALREIDDRVYNAMNDFIRIAFPKYAKFTENTYIDGLWAEIIKVSLKAREAELQSRRDELRRLRNRRRNMRRRQGRRRRRHTSEEVAEEVAALHDGEGEIAAEGEGESVAVAGEKEKEEEVDESIECPVCMMDTAAADTTQTTCGHRFCRWCLDAWRGKARSCPMCRNEL